MKKTCLSLLLFGLLFGETFYSHVAKAAPVILL